MCLINSDYRFLCEFSPLGSSFLLLLNFRTWERLPVAEFRHTLRGVLTASCQRTVLHPHFPPHFLFQLERNCRPSKNGLVMHPLEARLLGALQSTPASHIFWAGSQMLFQEKLTAKFLLTSGLIDKAFFGQLGSFLWTSLFKGELSWDKQAVSRLRFIYC